MRDHDDRAARHQIRQRCLHQRLALRVQRRGRLVQNQHRRVLQDRARNRQPLPLAAGEAEALLADHRVVALRHLQDEVVRQRGLRRFYHARERHIRLPVRDVVAHRVVEQDRLLRHLADLRAQRGQAHVAHIVAVDQDAPAGHIEEARNQVHQRRLSRPARPHNRHHFAALHGQIDVVQHHRRPFTVRVLLLVAEAHVLKCDAVLKGFERLGCFSSGTSSWASMKSKIAAERRRLLEVVVVRAEPAHRIVQLEHRDDEGEEDAHRHGAVADLVRGPPTAARQWPPRRSNPSAAR